MGPSSVKPKAPRGTARLPRRLRPRPAGTLLVLATALFVAAALTSAAGRSSRNVAAPAPTVSPAAGAALPALAPSLGYGSGTLRTTGPGPEENTWGGNYVAFTGERVYVKLSNTYPEDAEVGQRWANFLASLIHGPELGRVRAYLRPLSEVREFCGRGSLACYGPAREQIVAVAEDTPSISAESILMHEYGHHVAENRLNDPWAAVDWGTKRWATAMSVCPRVRRDELFPGDEEDNYTLNPGEGFAENYRVLNERRLGRPESPWAIVSRSLIPTQAALAALEQDVVSPWAGNTTGALAGRFVRGSGKARSFRVATPLDGRLRLALTGPASLRIRLAVAGASGRTIARGSAGARTLATNVCGQRTLRLNVSRLKGFGRFTLSVSKP